MALNSVYGMCDTTFIPYTKQTICKENGIHMTGIYNVYTTVFRV